MTSVAFASRATPEFRATTYYFTQFMAPGAAVTFLPIWLTERGITPEEVGLINAVPMLAMLLLNLIVGRLADRASDWRQVIVIGALLAGIAPFGLIFVNEFWGILLIWTLLSLPGGAIAPVMDAATMRLTKRNGTDFGAIRAWGTVGYMLFNVATGLLVAWYGSAAFVPLFIGLSLLRAGAAFWLPRFRAPETAPTLAAVTPTRRIGEVLKPWFILPLLGFSMVVGTHFILNGFAALMWKEQGIGEAIVGPLIALGALSEAAMMFLWKRLPVRLTARHMMLIAAASTALRWFIMAFSPPVWVLVLTQATHGLGFALGYLGSMHFIANWTSEDVAAEAQGWQVTAQQLMSVLCLSMFGWAFAAFGDKAMLVSAGIAALACVFIWLSLRMQQPKA